MTEQLLQPDPRSVTCDSLLPYASILLLSQKVTTDKNRLRQILLQRRLPFAFKSSEVIRALALTSEQVERIDQVIEATAPHASHHPHEGGRGRSDRRGGPDGRNDWGERGGPGRGGPTYGQRPRLDGPGVPKHEGKPPNPEKHEALKKTTQEIMKILAPSQRNAWNELIGEPLR